MRPSEARHCITARVRNYPSYCPSPFLSLSLPPLSLDWLAGWCLYQLSDAMNHLSLGLQPQLSKKSINFSRDTWLWCLRVRTMKDNSKHGTRTLKAGHGTRKESWDRRIVSQLPLKLYDQFISCRSGWCWKPCEVSCSPIPATLLSVKLDVATDRISQGKKSASQTEREIR